MIKVELIYDPDCPNVSKARAQLLCAFAESGLRPRWSEWDRGDPASPAYVRGYGSPTVLVEGKDVAGAEPSDGISCCRLYADPSGAFDGVPSVRLIASALRAGNKPPLSRKRSGRLGGWRSSLATLPGIGAALLPAGACPACWPAYAGLLGSLGLGFLLKTTYLLPLTTLFLMIAVGLLAFRAKTRRGYGPFSAGLLAAGIMLVGKFTFASQAAMYAGVSLLVAASVWNGWPRKMKIKGRCPACVPHGTASKENGNTKTTVEEVSR